MRRGTQKIIARGGFAVALSIINLDKNEMHTAWVKTVDEVEIIHHPAVGRDPFADTPDGILDYHLTGEGTLKLTWTPKTPPIDAKRFRCGRCGDDLLPSEIGGHMAAEGRIE